MFGNRVILTIVCLLVATAPAFGQGRSDSAPGKQKNGNTGTSATPNAAVASPATSTSSTSAPASSANAMIYYGSWLDDASVVEPGDIWISLSSGYWKADASRQVDVPVVSAAVGLSRRMQAGASLPIYHFSDGTGLTQSGIGNISMYGKWVMVDAASTRHGVGVAIAPLIEMTPGISDSFGWAVPVNIEARTSQVRVYGSAGYFSRGSVFATVAAQISAGDRIALSGNFGQSYASAGTHQTTIGVGAFFSASAKSGFFIGVGQTFSPIEVGPGGVSFGGGMSFLLPQPKKP
jgi:hypothetical protein